MEKSKYEFQTVLRFTIKNSFTFMSRDPFLAIKCGGFTGDYAGQAGYKMRNILAVHRQQIRETAFRKIFVGEHPDLFPLLESTFKYHMFPVFQ